MAEADITRADVLGRCSKEKGLSVSFQEMSSSISLLRTNHVVQKRETTLDDIGVSVHTSEPILKSMCVSAIARMCAQSCPTICDPYRL